MSEWLAIIYGLVADKMRQNPNWRFGQTVFNVCHKMYPECVNMLRATEYDCFYDNRKVAVFLDKVWNLFVGEKCND